MNVLFALLALVATSWLAEVTCQRPNYPYLIRRQLRQDDNDDRIRRQTNADQMVQNILHWLQGVYTQSSRKIRQGTIREYLPPFNTEKPRPFELPTPEGPEENTIGYPTPPEGVYPPIPPTYPGTGPQETKPSFPEYPTESPKPEAPIEPQEPGYPGPVVPKEELTERPGPEGPTGPQQPERPVEPGYPAPGRPEEEPGYPGPETPTIKPPESVKPTEPQEPGYPGPGRPGEVPEYPGPGKPEQEPGYPAPFQPTPQPSGPEGPTEPQAPGYPGPGRPSEEPGYPGSPEGPSQEPGYPGPTEGPQGPEGTTQPERPGGDGYPPAGQTPTPPFVLPTGRPEPGIPAETEGPQPVSPIPVETERPEEPKEPQPSPIEPTEKPQPEPELPSQPETTGYPAIGPSPTPALPEEKTEKLEEPTEPSPEGPETYTSPPGTIGPETPYQPGDLITSPPSTPPEKPGVTIQPETPTPEVPKEPTRPSEEDISHPPHIHALDVICDQDKMVITVEFNRQFDGIIYSKGNYNNLDCRYVNENSGKTKYEFTVFLNQCGTELVSTGEGADSSYLENVLVMQNEAGIQEVWDTVRAVRCQWEQSLKKSLTASLSVGMLNPEIVTFSGDSVMARLDIQQGEGPFAPTANGLVPIGEKMTLVVSVTGANNYDIQVKDCRAKDTDSKNEVLLTDENGCVLKPKLLGAFQKMNEPPGPTLAYAFFNAFKFPDIMDLLIECNVELCKEECEVCPNPNQKLRPGRRRRDTTNNTVTDPIRVGKLLRVLLPEDLSTGETIVKVKEEESICISVKTFVVSATFMISLLTTATIFSAYIYLKSRRSSHKH